ncbi:MAG: thioredoxin family protein [Chitinophagales bacterium]|nr:thioredoxin family protein [Chitinophagales bacterium]
MKKLVALFVVFVLIIALPKLFFKPVEKAKHEEPTITSADSTSQKELDDINKLFGEEGQVGETNDSFPTEAVAADSATIADDGYGVYGKPLTDCGDDKHEELNPWSAFFIGLLGGFAALFFPCTFPMIPMTMSFFLKGSEKGKGTRNAILYGFSIFLVYFLLSLPFNFGLLGGDALSNFSTNIWVNLAFFVIFLVFAISLFGFFDISLPSSIANKMDSKSSTGDFIGIFFMAFTLAIVSFSCTGPILGLVLASAKDAKFITPAFSGFGLGLGIPFAIFALFPKAMAKLPKSGSWLDVVKNVFAYIELAFAFKFLSNADLVIQWGLLKREQFVIIWIIIAILMGLYLIGKFAFKAEYLIKAGLTTNILGITSFIFAIYLMTDFFGGELNLISGFPPPKTYSISEYKGHFEQHENQYDLALEKAKKENKILFVDFTGHACVNCRKMEENVWPDKMVYEDMKNKFVIVSLFVDEKTSLPENEKRYSQKLKKELVTVGDKWSDFQSTNMHHLSQPQYALIDPNSGRIINEPLANYNEVGVFKKFIDCAINYKKQNP